MYDYMKKHESFIRSAINSNDDSTDWNGLLEFHEKQIGFIQHERLVHLLVTLFFGLFTLVTVLAILAFDKFELIPIGILFLVLLIPYIVHYFHLENGVQRWYHLSNEIRTFSGKASACYEQKKK